MAGGTDGGAVGARGRFKFLSPTYQGLRGRRSTALQWWHKSVARAQALGARYDLGITYMEMGKWSKDRAYLDPALDILTAIEARLDIAIAHRLLAEQASGGDVVRAALGAEQHFTQSIALLQGLGIDGELALAYAGYGRLHKRQARIAEARDYLTRALEIFERLGTLIEPDKVRAELAALPGG